MENGHNKSNTNKNSSSRFGGGSHAETSLSSQDNLKSIQTVLKKHGGKEKKKETTKKHSTKTKARKSAGNCGMPPNETGGAFFDNPKDNTKKAYQGVAGITIGGWKARSCTFFSLGNKKNNIIKKAKALSQTLAERSYDCY